MAHQGDSSKLITAVILTYNEEKHIGRCLKSIRDLCARIVIVDSNSTDQTAKIAKRYGAEVHLRPWPNKYAEQFNWGIDRAHASTPWMLRMDADEYLTPALRDEIQTTLPSLPDSVSGLVLPRLVLFQEKPIRHGGFYPQWMLRIWRTGLGQCENRMMDEHMVLTRGETLRLQNDLIDHNLNDIHWWTNKHNNYARREAADLIAIKYKLAPRGREDEHGNRQSQRKRWIKENIYAKMPTGVRSALYFSFRFGLQQGYLDHPRVWAFHFLQAAWYRTLVDVNVQEFEDAVGSLGRAAQLEFLRVRWNIRY